MASENPQGRRRGALAALVVDGPLPALQWLSASGSLTAEVVVEFLLALPSLPTSMVVVLDNAGIHRRRVVQEARQRLWSKRISL